jgi:hypothetical protein
VQKNGGLGPLQKKFFSLLQKVRFLMDFFGLERVEFTPDAKVGMKKAGFDKKLSSVPYVTDFDFLHGKTEVMTIIFDCGSAARRAMRHAWESRVRYGARRCAEHQSQHCANARRCGWSATQPRPVRINSDNSTQVVDFPHLQPIYFSSTP